ncbi:MAG: TRAP transporter large permease subunit [Flavobacteriales bacterium]|nr:TRAP transporter large permease subunit [Flavobacteriales bacterium]MCZ2444335.1 TRAP transporter large permease subunit [Flavobacteriales bacterium]
MEVFLVVFLLVLLIVLGSQLFLLIGAVSLALFALFGDVELFSLTKDMFDTVNKPALLSIPLYVFAGAIMSKGEIAKRLIDLMMAMFGWLKGGLAVGAILACVVFAAISGSSPVTLLAIGSVMFPAMIKYGYPENLALGSITTSGSLGIIIPPSIPMIIFSIMTGADVNKLFIAGILPGLITAALLIVLALLIARRYPLQTIPFSSRNLWKTFLRSIPALLMPFIIIGGIYGGIYNVTEAASVGAIYAILIELLYFRKSSWKEMANTLYDSVIVLGTIFIIIAMASIFNRFLILQDVPFWLIENLSGLVSSQMVFLMVTIGMLLIVGLFMDSISAILIMAPLLLPMARMYDVNLIHFGIIFTLALEIGYLTPPVGINLFVSSGLFNRPFGKVVVATFPYMLIILLTLMIVTFFPSLIL